MNLSLVKEVYSRELPLRNKLRRLGDVTIIMSSGQIRKPHNCADLKLSLIDLDGGASSTGRKGNASVRD